MKKAVKTLFAFIPLILCSCSSRTKNAFFSKEKLESFGVSDLPCPSGEIMKIDDDLVHFTSADSFSEYAKSVYQYLLESDLYYVGTYTTDGLVAEMVPNYVFEPIDESYDFSKAKHHFIYLTNNKINDRNRLDPCFEIVLSHFEKKTLPFSFFTYDSSMELFNNRMVQFNEENVISDSSLTF